jgi:hypothetical protein
MAIVATACGSASSKVDSLPLGSTVQVTRQDGGVIEGTLGDRDHDTVRVVDRGVERTVTRSDIVDVRLVDDRTSATLPPAAKFRECRLPEGTLLKVRLESAVASDTSRVEDPIEASLEEPVVIGGIEVLPAGAVLEGHVATAQPSGKVKGRASLALRFSSIMARGERYTLAARVEQVARATKGEDAEKIGLPAAGGAVIGALVGGKKGAAIGTAVGAGAGTAVVLTTSGPELRWPRGTRLHIPLDQALDVRVPLRRSSS